METSKITPVKPTISFATFEQVDLRVGTIKAVEEVQRSQKLVKLIVDFGDFKRTILSGLRPERKNLQGLVGKQTLFVVNLEPRKMMGKVSEGMLLDLGYSELISPVLIVPECPIANGSSAG